MDARSARSLRGPRPKPGPSVAAILACALALLSAGCSGASPEPRTLRPAPPFPARPAVSRPLAYDAPRKGDRAHPEEPPLVPAAPKDGPRGGDDVPPTADAPPEPSEAADPGPSRSRSREEIRRAVGDYVRRLKADEDSAREAFVELWEVEADLIPELIEHVVDSERSALREIAVLVLDTGRFFQRDPKDGTPIYTIPGLGAFELDDVAAGKVPAGAKAVLRNFERFPVGVVVRAALVNRFRSRDYPSGDDRVDVKGWWRRYYQRVRPNL